MNKPTAIIIGAGISGATAAKQLRKLGYNILVLEKNNYIGGKLHSIAHQNHPGLKAELGAGVFACNYEIIDALVKHNISFEKLIPMRRDTVESLDVFDHLSTTGKIKYSAKFVSEWLQFSAAVRHYHHLVAEQKPLPIELQLPFSEYTKKYKLSKIATFMKFLMPGFGYGTLDDASNPTWRIFSYMGYLTIPNLALTSLASVHGGYQSLVEESLKDFNVKTSVQVNSIKRKDNKVTVNYSQNGQTSEIVGDLLILTASPYYWSSLGMELTKNERKVVESYSCHPYPVAVCNIKGLPPENLFIRDALEKEGFGHAAFLFTRDQRKNPSNGRFFTVYINVDPSKKYDLSAGSKDRITLVNDLKKLGADSVEFVTYEMWPDYNLTVPWQVGIDLVNSEKTANTIYLGSYLPNSFETVACVVKYAREHINAYFNKQASFINEKLHDAKRLFLFSTLPREKPYDDQDIAREEIEKTFSYQPG